MRAAKIILQRWGKLFLISLFLILAFTAGNTTGFFQNSHPQVLGIQAHISPYPLLKVTPAPTSTPVTIINNIIVPTSMPTSVMPTVAPTPYVIVVTPIPTFQLTPTATPTISPTPVPQTVTVTIDYAGEHQADSYTATITSGETAWQVIQGAVELKNLHYTDYGGSLGIFITGFNGIDATANQYYDFQVNGVSASVGISSYTVTSGDILKFVLTSF